MGKGFVLLLLQSMLWVSAGAQLVGIKAGHLIDPESGRISDNQIILVEGDRIVAVVEDASGYAVDDWIDLSEAWVSPGLMDCHVHLTLNISYQQRDILQIYAAESDAYRVLRGVQYAREFLEGGFTTVKEIGNDGNYATADLIRAIDQGWVKGPTIIYAGKIIAPYGGQLPGVAPQSGHAWHREYLDADTHEEIKKAIRQNVYYGANTIKMAADIFPYVYAEEDIAFAVREAAAYGLRVSVHVGGGPAADNVIRGGAASIEHGFFLSQEQLQLMKEKGTFLVGTDFSYENWLSYGLGPEKTQELFATTTNRLKQAYQTGVRMAFGSDVVYNIPGKNRLQSSMEVLQTWKAAGIPAMYVLKTMTSEAAALMGIEKERGKIAAGWLADIVAFRKDPSLDILDISSVQFVMKNGKVVRKDP